MPRRACAKARSGYIWHVDENQLIQMATQWETRAAGAREAMQGFEAQYRAAYDAATRREIDRPTFEAAKSEYETRKGQFDAFVQSYQDFYAQHPGLREQVREVQAHIAAGTRPEPSQVVQPAPPAPQPQYSPPDMSDDIGPVGDGDLFGTYDDIDDFERGPRPYVPQVKAAAPVRALDFDDEPAPERKAARPKKSRPAASLGWGKALAVSAIAQILAAVVLAIPMGIVILVAAVGLVAALVLLPLPVAIIGLLVVAAFVAIMQAAVQGLMLKLLAPRIAGIDMSYRRGFGLSLAAALALVPMTGFLMLKGSLALAGPLLAIPLLAWLLRASGRRLPVLAAVWLVGVALLAVAVMGQASDHKSDGKSKKPAKTATARNIVDTAPIEQQLSFKPKYTDQEKDDAFVDGAFSSSGDSAHLAKITKRQQIWLGDDPGQAQGNELLLYAADFSDEQAATSGFDEAATPMQKASIDGFDAAAVEQHATCPKVLLRKGDVLVMVATRNVAVCDAPKPDKAKLGKVAALQDQIIKIIAQQLG
jgi:hypothetical protein